MLGGSGLLRHRALGLKTRSLSFASSVRCLTLFLGLLGEWGHQYVFGKVSNVVVGDWQCSGSSGWGWGDGGSTRGRWTGGKTGDVIGFKQVNTVKVRTLLTTSSPFFLSFFLSFSPCIAFSPLPFASFPPAEFWVAQKRLFLPWQHFVVLSWFVAYRSLAFASLLASQLATLPSALEIDRPSEHASFLLSLLC